jgi:hypothetical protein
VLLNFVPLIQENSCLGRIALSTLEWPILFPSAHSLSEILALELNGYCSILNNVYSVDRFVARMDSVSELEGHEDK